MSEQEFSKHMCRIQIIEEFNSPIQYSLIQRIVCFIFRIKPQKYKLVNMKVVVEKGQFNYKDRFWGGEGLEWHVTGIEANEDNIDEEILTLNLFTPIPVELCLYSGQTAP